VRKGGKGKGGKKNGKIFCQSERFQKKKKKQGSQSSKQKMNATVYEKGILSIESSGETP